MGLPIPNLDDKRFDEIVEEARSLIARYAPEWTDHNVHDPGITFIELFAYLAEMQIYQLNRVTDENYLKFLKLVGFYPLPAEPARVDITFQNVKEEKTIPAGTQLITEKGAERIVFETEENFNIIPVKLKSIITKHDSQTIDNTQANEKDDIYFTPFGEKASKGAELRLGFDKPLPEKEIQLTFVMVEEDLPLVGKHGDESPKVFPSAEVAWEYLSGVTWNELIVKKDTTWALTRSGKVVFSGPLSMAEKDGLYWIRCRLREGQYEIVPQINRILLNTVPAIQIETVRNEDLGTGNGMPEQVVKLKKKPLLMECLSIQVREKSGRWKEWYEVVDFDLSGPHDPHYTFNHEKGEIAFGNGLNGRIPDESQKIRACLYKTSLGSKGNIPKGQNFRIDKGGLEGIERINLKEATGGRDAESMESAMLRAKKDFRTAYRAVTSDDYERLAISTPGLRVARAKAIPGYHPDFPCISDFPAAVTVVVVPYVREGVVTPVAGEGFINTVFEHLNIHRLVTTDLYVIGPEYVKVFVKCKVRIKKRSMPDMVKERVKKALEDFLDPLKGGPDGDGWSFGRSVFPSEIYRVIDKVEGVDYATAVSLSAEGNYRKEEEIIKIPRVALVFSGEHDVEII